MPQTSAVAERRPGPSPAHSGSDFAPLLRTVKARGLLGRRHGWYARAIALNVVALAAVVTGVTLNGDSWWTLLVAPPLAVLCARTAFIGHDAGHAQLTGNRTAGRVIGLVHANLLLGLSYSWWNRKHNRHHAHPNHIDKYPDVAADVPVFTGEQAKDRTGFRRLLTRHQAWLLFPLTLLEGVALKVHGFRDLRRQPPRERSAEAVLLATHAAGCATLRLTSMSPGKALAFAALHQALFGLHLGLAFAPDHKGMAMPDPDAEPWGHLRRQVLTRATSVAAPSPTGSSAVSTTRSSTTSSRACPARISVSPNLWCAPTARSWMCRTRRLVSSTPTGRRCATCTRWGSHCGRSRHPAADRPRGGRPDYEPRDPVGGHLRGVSGSPSGTMRSTKPFF